MKQIKLIAIFFATYHISSFSAEHQLDPRLKTMINETFIIERKYTETQLQKQIEHYVMIQRENTKANDQRIINHNNQFLQISQKELDTWVANKEREIKENQEKRRKEQEQMELKCQQEYYKKNRNFKASDKISKARRLSFRNDHRNRYNPKTKTIICYQPQLLLEWKK